MLPGGAVLAVVAGLAQTGALPLATAPLRDFFLYSVVLAGALLALRFRSPRVLLALLALLLAGLGLRRGLSPAGVAAIAFLLPVNLAAAAFGRERGLHLPALGTHAGLLVVQAAVVLLLGRPEHGGMAGVLQFDLLPQSWLAWTGVPQPGLLAFAASAALLIGLFGIHHDPVQSGLAWAALAAVLAARAGSGEGMALVYLAAGGLALTSTLVEAGYRLAYHDELTLLPARRAFNDLLLRLEEESAYAIAIVDVDHFKRFNDTFGHETGDQVLKMVAGRLARVGGGGEAFRVGGEEFAVAFPGRSAEEAAEALEELRRAIEATSFRLRAPERRRSAQPIRGPDRRARDRRGGPPRPRQRSAPSARHEVFVTVSIGVADRGRGRRSVEQVLRAADKALYAAKESGRNQVQIAAAPSRERRPQAKPAAEGRS